MTPDVVYGFDDQEVQDAAHLMAQYEIRQLLVLNHSKQLVDMVAFSDLTVHAGTQPVTAEVLAQVSESEQPGANSGPRQAITHGVGAVQACACGRVQASGTPTGGTMSPETYTAEAIQQAIAQGAITEAYQADPQRVIQALNQLRATEVTSYLQYKQHAYIPTVRTRSQRRL